jgi:hypothetical protein
MGRAVTQWLRYYATNRQAADSIPDGVIGIFQCRNPSGRTMALGSTQPLTEKCTRVFPGGKGGRCVRLTTLTPSCAVVMKCGNLNFLEPSGPTFTPDSDNATASVSWQFIAALIYMFIFIYIQICPKQASGLLWV